MLKQLALGLIGALLAVLMLQSHTAAQSTVNLQADVNQLRAQVNQLQAQVSQLGRQNFPSTTTGSSGTRSRARSPELSDSQIVDRLATLAIEAKERISALEARVNKLEKRVR